MYPHHRSSPSGPEDALGAQAYRLKHWPYIPERFRTAKVLRACSRMSVGPVTAGWFHAQVGLQPDQVARLLRALVAQDAIECIDLGGRMAARHKPAVPADAPVARRPWRFAWRPAAFAAVLGGLAASTAALEQHFHGLGLFALYLPVLFG